MPPGNTGVLRNHRAAEDGNPSLGLLTLLTLRLMPRTTIPPFQPDPIMDMVPLMVMARLATLRLAPHILLTQLHGQYRTIILDIQGSIQDIRLRHTHTHSRHRPQTPTLAGPHRPRTQHQGILATLTVIIWYIAKPRPVPSQHRVTTSPQTANVSAYAP